MRTAINPMGATDMAKDYIIDYGSNSNGYYRKWKSGFIEQWGIFTIPSNAIKTFNLPISFTNINYFCTTDGISSSSSGDVCMSHVSRTLSSVTGRFAISGQHYFFACGY